MSETTQDRTRALLEEAIQAPDGSLTRELVLREVEGWDSMGAVLFIGLVKEHLSVELTVHDLRESTRVGDLLDRVQELAG